VLSSIFGGLAKNSFRILLVAGSLTFATIYRNSFSAHSNSGLASEQFQLKESLACSDLIQMARWGSEHHGVKANRLDSVAFAKRTGLLFVQKMDPHRVLFLQSEANELTRKAQTNWKTFLNNKDCSVFESWYDQYFPSSKRRFLARTKRFSEENPWPLIQKSHSAKKPAVETFAQDESELRQVQDNFISDLVSSAAPEVAKAYKHKKEQFYQERIEQALFSEEVTARSILAKAILGALDPYSTYFSKNEFKDFYEELSGETAGIGIRVQKSLKGLWVEEVISQSPAEKAGIRKGDLITQIEGRDLEGLSFSDSTELLKGAKDTEVELTVGTPKTSRTFSINRSEAAFQDKKVTSYLKESSSDKKVAVVSIPSFYGRGGMGAAFEGESSSEDVKKQIQLLKQKGEPIDSLVLDLRGNPGGYLEEAVMMSGLFLGSQTIVGVKDNQETRIMKPENVQEPLYQGPLVILVDGETASAGEVLAAALKEHQRGVLVGTPATFGKGSVQKLFQLDDPFLDMGVEQGAGVLKLTTSIFYSPLGHSPANGGVTTHIQLKSAVAPEELAKKTGEVEEISPLLDAKTLQNLKENQPLFQEALNQLAEQQKKNGLVVQQDSDRTLIEAIEVAGDLSQSPFEIARGSSLKTGAIQ
jgi:C-terminal peptidase prc